MINNVSWQLGTLEYEKNEETDDENGALVHVWRCRDGVGLGLLRGGGERVVTALSFSPSSRFLASLADGDTIHIFNWIKGELRSGATQTTDMLIFMKNISFIEVHLVCRQVFVRNTQLEVCISPYYNLIHPNLYSWNVEFFLTVLFPHPK